MPDNKHMGANNREAVCVDAGRVFDSCCERDCLEDLRVDFTEQDQMMVDHAVNVRARKAEVITTYIDVEALPFNKGCYSCDLTFYFEVYVDVITGRNAPCTTICGVAMFQKRVILYGGEGSVKVFSSEFRADGCDPQDAPTRNLPRCNVQVATPVILDSRVSDPCDRVCRPSKNDCGCECGCSRLPSCVSCRFNGAFREDDDCRILCVTIGVFTIVQLIRSVQMLMPVYDYCMPTKECSPNTDNPCDLFRKMNFPVDEFFPPKEEPACGCGNTGSNPHR